MKQFTEMKFGDPNKKNWDVKISIRNRSDKSTQELLQAAITEICKGGDPVFPLLLAHEVAKDQVSGQLIVEPHGDVVGYFPGGTVDIVVPANLDHAVGVGAIRHTVDLTDDILDD